MNNMTREKAKETLLNHINRKISEHGEDYEYAYSRREKMGWTCRQYKRAVENDECLEGTTVNPIDALIKCDAYLKKIYGPPASTGAIYQMSLRTLFNI